ncbi:MAG: hypothetical protein PHQ19_00970, partial [Candidatus Krumholzibacteria bacterium]|nr:hypothetical protein [Candidatus Krumholzibacteria bacterium]
MCTMSAAGTIGRERRGLRSSAEVRARADSLIPSTQTPSIAARASRRARRGGAGAQRGERRDRLRERLLPVADEERVEGADDGQRVGDAGASGDHHRIAVAAPGGLDRNPREVDHVQGVGIVQLVRQGDPDDIEPPRRRSRLPRTERLAAGAQPLLEVGPRGEGEFDADPREIRHDVVEHAQPLVGHTDLVDVGEDEEHVEAARGESSSTQVELGVDVARGLLDAGQDPVDIRIGSPHAGIAA